jgi:hypothetical protein
MPGNGLGIGLTSFPHPCTVTLLSAGVNSLQVLRSLRLKSATHPDILERSCLDKWSKVEWNDFFNLPDSAIGLYNMYPDGSAIHH